MNLKLQKATATLREQGRKGKTSQEIEEDIVDPYLFPFAWDKTRLLRREAIQRTDCIARCGEGDVVQKPPEQGCKEPDHGRFRNDVAYSRRFQWLPFDLAFDSRASGSSRCASTSFGPCSTLSDIVSFHRIKSYINNVHPLTQSDLYGVAEKLIDAFIPLFNRVLVDAKAPGWLNQRIHLVSFGRDPFIKRDPSNFRPPEQRAYQNFLDDNGGYQQFMLVDLKKEFWNVGLQMILQLRDINLSPEHPEYGGEDWHVQGQTV